VDGNVNHLGCLSVLKDQTSLAAGVVLPGHGRKVLCDPINGHSSVTAVGSSHWYLSYADALFDEKTRLLELEHAGIWT